MRASAGRQLATGVDLALSGTYERSDGVSRLYFPAFDATATNNGVAEGLDGEGVKQLYGRLTFKGLDVTGAFGTRQRDVPTASVDTVFNEQLWREETTDRHTLVDAQYARVLRGTRLTLRASYDRFTYAATFPFRVEPDGTPTLVGNVTGIGTRWSASSGLTRSFRGRQTVRAGVEFVDNVDHNQTARYMGAADPVLDTDRSSMQQAIYAQDEIRISRWVIVNAGLRYDRYEQFVRVTPRAALIVLPSPIQSFKYLYGRALRAPNEYELNSVYFGERVTSLLPEKIDTHEVVWERYAHDRVRTAVSAYRYEADSLITSVFDDSTLVGVSFINQGRVRAKGLELEAQVRLKGEARTLVSYAVQDAVDQQTGLGLKNSPRHVAKARLSLPGPSPHSFVSFEGHYLSSRTTVVDSRVPGAAILNIHIVQPLGWSWELFGGVRNIFGANYSDPVSAQHRQDAIEQNGRTARIGLRWNLRKP